MAKTARKRKSTARRGASTETSKSLWPLLAVAVVTVGGLLAYEHRADLLPGHGRRPATVDTDPLKVAAVPRLTDRVKPKLTTPKKEKLPTPGDRPLEVAMLGSGFTAHFAYCGTTGLKNCVVNGNTFWHNKVKIRIAGIDAPAIEHAKCETERKRGAAATVRLRALLNAGSFTLTSVGGRGDGDGDQKLRIVSRQGRSLGDMLVSEGLARSDAAAGRPWC